MTKKPDDIIVVDNQDEIIGHKERADLKPTDITRVSALWATNSNGDVLLAQRKLTKKYCPGKWGPAVAGTVEADETYLDNIIKEAWEEIGLQNIQPQQAVKSFFTEGHNHFTQYFTLVVDKPADDFVIQEDEVEQVRWFTRQELKLGLKNNPDDFIKSMSWCIENL